MIDPSPATAQSLLERSLQSQFHAHYPWAALTAGDGLVIVRGEGPYLFDSQGRRYLDGISGGWNVALGYSCTPLIDAACQQLKTLPYSHTLYNRVTEVSVELSETLKQLAPFPGGKVVYCNSGSEAVETAVKLSWFYHAARGEPKRRKVLVRAGSVHGSTVVTGCLGGLGMQDLLPVDSSWVIRLSSPNPALSMQNHETTERFVARLVDELRDSIAREGADVIAAMLIEPVPVVEGFHVPPPQYLTLVKQILEQEGILLIFDEVVTGFQRTGELFAATLLSCTPDILVLGKALTSGYAALAATVLSQNVAAAIDEFSAGLGEFPHALTTAMHPVAMAVARENIRRLTDQSMSRHMQLTIAHFQERLAALARFAAISRVDGVGLGGSVHLRIDRTSCEAGRDPAFELARACRSRGVLIHGQHGALIFAPPLICDKAQLDQLFDGLEEVLGEAV